MYKTAILVLNWNKPDLTLDSVNSILKINSRKIDYQIVIIDNGSSDDSLAIFNKHYQTHPQVKIITTNSNLGFAGGNNFGIQYALKNNFDYILLINNDVLVDSDFLINLLRHTKDYDLLGPKIYFAPGFEFHSNRYAKKDRGRVIWSAGGQFDWNNIYGSHIGVDEVDSGQFDTINSQVDFLTACCLLVKASVFQKIGLLDDKYFMYLEDVDFCHRAKLAGFRQAYIPDSKIWHINAGSSSSGGDLHNYFLTRNRLLFGFRYASLKTKLALFKESILKLFDSNVAKWQKTGIIDFYLKKFYKGSWQ